MAMAFVVLVGPVCDRGIASHGNWCVEVGQAIAVYR